MAFERGESQDDAGGRDATSGVAPLAAKDPQQIVPQGSRSREDGRFKDREPARGQVRRAPAPEPEESTPVHIDKGELVKAVGPAVAMRLERKLKEAARAFDRERFDEALPKLRSLARDAPGAASVRELHGLALYRVGRWNEAARELEAFAQISDSAEQHPVIADCYRALRRWEEVERIWGELRDISPSSALVNEGRIVAAGALADQGRITDAVELLAKGLRKPRHMTDHHLRRLYALADLYERAGDLGRARTLFREVAAADPELADVAMRVRALG